VVALRAAAGLRALPVMASNGVCISSRRATETEPHRAAGGGALMDGIYGVVASARHHLERTSGSGFASEAPGAGRPETDKAAGRAEARIPQRGFGSGLGWDSSARGAAAGSVKAVAMATVAGVVVVVSFKRGVVGLRSLFDLDRVRACVRAVFLFIF